ncbi:MAG: hypothetical protein MZV64_14695 [Ignavibacteriales bacterium]|nr:hypothetical protein [Ignavibacteriales bacterium]
MGEADVGDLRPGGAAGAGLRGRRGGGSPGGRGPAIAGRLAAFAARGRRGDGRRRRRRRPASPRRPGASPRRRGRRGSCRRRGRSGPGAKPCAPGGGRARAPSATPWRSRARRGGSVSSMISIFADLAVGGQQRVPSAVTLDAGEGLRRASAPDRLVGAAGHDVVGRGRRSGVDGGRLGRGR